MLYLFITSNKLTRDLSLFRPVYFEALVNTLTALHILTCLSFLNIKRPVTDFLT